MTQNFLLDHHAFHQRGVFCERQKEKFPNFRGKYLALKKPRLDINDDKKLFHVDELSQPIISVYTLNHSFDLYDLAPQILLNYVNFSLAVEKIITFQRSCLFVFNIECFTKCGFGELSV